MGLKLMLQQLLPILLKYLLPLLGLGVAGYQGSLVAEGDASPLVSAAISIPAILAAIASFFGGNKLKEFSESTVLNALNYLDTAIDKVAVHMKVVIRNRLLQILQRLFDDDNEANEAIATLSRVGADMMTGASARAAAAAAQAEAEAAALQQPQYAPQPVYIPQPAPVPVPQPRQVAPAPVPAPAPAPVAPRPPGV